MTTCTLPDTASLFDVFDDGGTLDQLASSMWESLGAGRTVACPVCGEEMKPQYGVHARPIGGRCSACQSTLR
jgi:hypothetical protein